MTIGYMPMPADFKYKEVFLKGYPHHDRLDPFRVRHPSMDNIRRAKLFSPFAALAGFSTAIGNKEEQYVVRREPPEGLNQILNEIQKLTFNGKAARENNVLVEISYYVPCDDPWSEWYQVRGKYKSITGVVKNVDNISGTITILTNEKDEMKIRFPDIGGITILS